MGPDCLKALNLQCVYPHHYRGADACVSGRWDGVCAQHTAEYTVSAHGCKLS